MRSSRRYASFDLHARMNGQGICDTVAVDGHRWPYTKPAWRLMESLGCSWHLFSSCADRELPGDGHGADRQGVCAVREGSAKNICGGPKAAPRAAVLPHHPHRIQGAVHAPCCDLWARRLQLVNRSVLPSATLTVAPPSAAALIRPGLSHLGILGFEASAPLEQAISVQRTT